MVLYKMKKTGSEKPTQNKEITATTSQQVVTNDSGYELRRVTVYPQEHTASSRLTQRNSAIDLGAHHNVRYIDTTGVGLKRTKLWENTAPTSNFSAQAIALNNVTSNNDYDYYEIVYKPSTSASDATYSAVIPKELLTDSDNVRGAFGAKSSKWYVRYAYFAATASLQITTSYQTSTTTTSAAKVIPLEVYGLKY